MALAGHDHVIITIKAALGGPACHMNSQCSKTGPLRGLAFLAAKSTPHAPTFTRHQGIGNRQHAGYTMLHFRGMLRRGVNQQAPLLRRNDKRNLALKIKMFLATDQQF